MRFVEFFKVHGNGNDFVFVDDLGGRVSSLVAPSELAVKVCHRRKGIGADGVLLLQDGDGEVQFRMRIFNSDGTEADMCGNGARCFARMLDRLGLEDPKMRFLAGVGVVEAQVDGSLVSLKMGFCPFGDGAFFGVPESGEGVPDGVVMSYLHVGVPHAVLFARSWDIGEEELKVLGRRYRHDGRFPRGANVTFLMPLGGVDGSGGFFARTYERGVEDLTLSCGTGACACAAALLRMGFGSPVRIESPGGFNVVEVEAEPHGARYVLTGPAEVSARGVFYL
ncbi:diaminopimelate epimerase [Thermanaerovibrio velox DSM 12556]|uniref:Diaminopimelate epimerase n=1 Tax=Thermanaerovibrio velox DSM 12556 TaxID=926567 RepID=H0UMZ0_9BACT|nr:diaminopimelate epimerase [Thermanaerovibrio velox DSM 12556]